MDLLPEIKVTVWGYYQNTNIIGIAVVVSLLSRDIRPLQDR